MDPEVPPLLVESLPVISVREPSLHYDVGSVGSVGSALVYHWVFSVLSVVLTASDDGYLSVQIPLGFLLLVMVVMSDISYSLLILIPRA